MWSGHIQNNAIILKYVMDMQQYYIQSLSGVSAMFVC
jgi:hypothetical protein